MALNKFNEGFILVTQSNLSKEVGWLVRQKAPVIAVGEGVGDIGEGFPANADVFVRSEQEAEPVIRNIIRSPIAALVLTQVLRIADKVDIQSGLTVESLAYSALQSGAEYRRWLDAREEAPQLVTGVGRAIVVERSGDVIRAVLNRPANRNSLTVEMRDALVELLQLLEVDQSIRRLELSGNGDCFSVGGELREFGLSKDPAEAHCVRSEHNPSRLLAELGERVHCHLHSACIGSGIELPAFAKRVTAQRRTYFQLPELKLGLIPGAGGCLSIARRIGRHRTAWMALSGKRVNTETALAWGLIDEIAN
ncbi:MAG: enoyl-CoA hydratase/isomerase family protein [Pseudomonadales bacterium]|nr:MAG: enoyl-CoA hydratase/isomerase family protein [Pseudomonadales bacterium]